MAAVPPAGPPNFALMPAQAFAHGLIDYETRDGVALYRNYTRPLYTDTTQLFNGKPDSLLSFLNHVSQRIREASWNDLFDVPIVLGAQFPDLRTFTLHHGIFTLEHLVNFATPIMAANTRQSQDNFMASTAFMASLNDEVHSRVSSCRQQYTINGQISAVCLLKVIIRESHLDSSATTRFARENLSSLDVHIKAQGYDIVKLNTFIQQQLDILRSRGQDTLDLLPNLFKGYKAATDHTFVRYIEDKETRYDDDELNLTPEQFMHLAANKYKVLVEGKLWNAPNKDQAKILALQSEVNQLKSAVQGGGRARAPSANNDVAANSATTQRGKYQPEPWMLVKPSDEDIKNETSRTEKGREYWWCTNHARYVQHKPSVCKYVPKTGKEPATGQGTDTSVDDGNRALKLTKALVAISSGQKE